MKQPTTLREINYKRYEYGLVLATAGGTGETDHRGSLLTFVYDIPYFDACGIFPPFHIANQIFAGGGGRGGMSPGTIWAPFTISEHEYSLLVDAVCSTPISEIKPHARYAFAQMQLDSSFDHIQDRMEWFAAVCQKHREEWHNRIRNAGASARHSDDE